MLPYYMLYIFWFLHQTTTLCLSAWTASGCISFDSYIKPQLWRLQPSSRLRCISFDSYIKPQLTTYTGNKVIVVYLLIPTSNHNFNFFELIIYQLYIFWFLHQTTTRRRKGRVSFCCISFDSYIKPQRLRLCCRFLAVVYLLIPTSNHNVIDELTSFKSLYIFWFLHQTTTVLQLHQTPCRCISFDSYIKPQHHIQALNHHCVVYLLIPTSNHN